MDAVYSVTFKQDYNGYAAGETAAFVKATATKLFALGIGDLSSGDQSTLAADIVAAQAAFPLQPRAVEAYVDANGIVTARRK
jgi:hypothetical protein